ADFADGTLQGLARAADGALVLAEETPLDAEQRPRAYAERAAWGTYVSSPRDLARPVTQVEATLDADLPPGADVVLEVRGRTLEGHWTPWTEVELGGAPAPLDAPSNILTYRLTLLADAPGDAGPRVRGG